MTPLELVKVQFDAYNARDADAMCACYAEDCIIANLNGEITIRGRDAIRKVYGRMFAANPQTRAWSHHRAAVGNIVVEHEEGELAPGGAGRFEVLAIYTIQDDLIARLDMVRQ